MLYFPVDILFFAPTRLKAKKNARKRSLKPIIFSGIILLCLALAFWIYRNIGGFLRVAESYTTGVMNSIGFVVKNINVLCEDESLSQQILLDSAIKKQTPIFVISPSEIQSRVMDNPWVQAVQVRRILPHVIEIRAEKRKAIAIFQKNNKLYQIDSRGRIIVPMESRGRLPLPLIVGEVANERADETLGMIANFRAVRESLASLVLVRGRRWDLVMRGGLVVRLPESEIKKALEMLNTLLSQKKINKNSVKYIDLRMPGNIILGYTVEKN
jgi:cell division protein FtsQ